MASEETQPLPSAAIRQNNFEQGVAYALHLWPALTLSVQNSWGGPDSSDKRDWFVGAVVDLWPEFSDAAPAKPATQEAASEPDLQDVETVILQIMVDEFEVNVDDDSGAEVAQQIIACRAQCAVGVWDEVEKLRVRFSNRGQKKVDGALFKKIEADDQDTDWESDDEVSGEDEEMGDAPAPVVKEKKEPEVDEDGFTKVTRKR